jgi:hypothetical protein
LPLIFEEAEDKLLSIMRLVYSRYHDLGKKKFPSLTSHIVKHISFSYEVPVRASTPSARNDKHIK